MIGKYLGQLPYPLPFGPPKNNLFSSVYCATFVKTTFTFMNNRLEQFIAAENISKAEFADNIGVARASVSHILAGRNKPSYDFILGIMQRYPRLNTEWLLAGKGKMYKEPTAAPETAPVAHDEPEYPDLFSDTGKDPISLRESPISAPVDIQPANTAPTEEETLPEDMGKPVENQRKITKIIVFFDDNTFQELS